MRRIGPFVASLAVLGFLGCGGDGLKRVHVEGRVSAKGVSVSNATILFMPADGTQGEGGIGSTDADGRYTLTGSRRGDSGVVPGKYKVRVSRFVDRDGTVLPSDHKQADYPHAVESVPAPFSSPESTLVVTVPETGGTIDIEIPGKLLGKK
jgi:hypothetical protein